jgi:hypothetical protein
MKQIIVLLIVICASILAGILPSKKYILILFEYTGYYFVFIAFFLWVAYLFKYYFSKLKSLLRNHYDGLLLSAVLIVLIFCIAPPKFKVLSDETNLVGISMAMYQSKKASLPLRGFNVDFQKPEYFSKIDKRPILYPLLVSFVHTLRGYSAYNGFVVNFICGFMVLFLFYLFTYDLLPRIYALISLLVVASLPIFVIWVTSSGFETLNLFFILATLFIFYKAISNRNIRHAEFLLLTLVLVSQCRYESIIFTVAILFLLPTLLNKKSIANLSISTYLTPVLFIPTLWLPRLYADRPIVDKMAMGAVHVPSLFDAFSLSNLISNASSNLIVFLGFDPQLGFSPVISAMSLAGFYLITKKLIVGRKSTSLEFRTMWLFGTITFCLMYFIQVSFFLGDMTIATQNRFAMAYLPYMVLPAMYFIHKIINKVNISSKILIWIFFGFHLLYFWPYGSQQLLVNRGTIPYEYNKTLSYIRNNFESHSNILVICERPNFYILHYQGALDFEYANQNPELIINKVAKDFDHILVLQKCLHNTRAPLKTSHLNKSYPLVDLQTLKLTQTEYLKISKLISDT